MAADENSKVLFWNIWGNCGGEPLNKSLVTYAKTADILCLTEVMSYESTDNRAPLVHASLTRNEPPSQLDGIQQLDKFLGTVFFIEYVSPEYKTWKCMKSNEEFKNVGFGSALMYRKSLAIIDTGHKYLIELPETKQNDPMQWIVYRKNNENILVAHLHGLWIRENTKGDHPLRELQSREIFNELQRLTKLYSVTKVVFGGDLNLALDTNALRQLENENDGKKVYKNLIREFGIESTRTSSYRKYNQPNESQHADYVLVSPQVDVIDFQVDISKNMSDHAPLIVTFN